MQENNSKRRISFAVELLLELKDAYRYLKQSSSDIEKCSGSFYEELFHESKSSIQNLIDQYNTNVDTVRQLTAEITVKINSWYKFSKDPEEVKRFLYPLKFRLRKKGLLKSIRKANQRISDITIENRFLKERFAGWEQELELMAVQRIKQGGDFKAYEHLLGKKDMLVTELKYIIPTITGLCPAAVNLDDIDSLVEKLKEMEAA